MMQHGKPGIKYWRRTTLAEALGRDYRTLYPKPPLAQTDSLHNLTQETKIVHQYVNSARGTPIIFNEICSGAAFQNEHSLYRHEQSVWLLHMANTPTALRLNIYSGYTTGGFPEYIHSIFYYNSRLWLLIFYPHHSSWYLFDTFAFREGRVSNLHAFVSEAIACGNVPFLRWPLGESETSTSAVLSRRSFEKDNIAVFLDNSVATPSEKDPLGVMDMSPGGELARLHVFVVRRRNKGDDDPMHIRECASIVYEKHVLYFSTFPNANPHISFAR